MMGLLWLLLNLWIENKKNKNKFLFICFLTNKNMKKENFSNKQFGKIRSFLWPIYNHELKKLIPMFSLFFLISFAYNLLRNMKIALIVTLKGSGAHAIPFLKIGAVLPGALFMTYIFTKLINRFSREYVFYTMLIGFLFYFFLFMFVFFPYRKYFELNMFADFLNAHVFFAEGLSGLVAIIRYWNLSLFYVLCEMWSAVVLSMLFWGFANEVTKIDEAKRFYAIFALGANASGIFIGLFTNWLGHLNLYFISFYEDRYQWVFYQLLSVLIVGIIIIILFYWLNRFIFSIDSNPRYVFLKETSSNLSLMECFSYLRKSRYLTYIVIIVIVYNIVYNLSDVMWSYKIKQIYNDSKSFNSYISQITLATGLVATVFAFVISGNVIRYYGWTMAALITPAMWLVTSVCFFSGLLLEDFFSGEILLFFTSNPVNFVLLLGSAQICLGRGCKYTVFDETKEIAFIPLSKENQRKSKAIVDGLASRFGKSGGSIIYIGLLVVVGDIALTIPYVSLLIIVAIILWIIAVFGLGRMINVALDLNGKNQKSINFKSNVSNKK